MAYAIIHKFPVGTKEQYEASLAAVHPTRGSLPDGQIFHKMRGALRIARKELNHDIYYF